MPTSESVTDEPQIHALMIVSGVSRALVSKEQNKNLRGTLTDKINVENFCYNYQNYVLHPTLQFSEDDIHKIKRPTERLKSSQNYDFTNDFSVEQNQAKPSLRIDEDNGLRNLTESIRKEKRFTFEESKSQPENIQKLAEKNLYFDPNNKEDREAMKEYFKRKTIRILENFFERGKNEHCLLFLSGHGHKKATFVLNDGVNAHLTLKEILQIWDRKNSCEWIVQDRNGKLKTARSHLLIVIDACNSGSFTSMIQKEYRRPMKDVSIQTSSSTSEKSYDDVSGGGGYFLNNLLYINGLKDIKYNYSYRRGDNEQKERMDWQRPTFYSNFPELERAYRLKIGFNRWEELEWRVSTSLSGTFIGDNGDIFKGEFKSIQLHGKGEKRLANGRLETGVFRNDKLDGEGEIKWNNFVCTGKFDRGRLSELYSARLSTGTEISLLEKDSLNFKKYSVSIQDDMIQEITKLNETNQSSCLFEWVLTFYINSDTNMCLYKDGIRHGNSFHLKKDGGIILSQWKDGVQHYSYAADENGRLEVSVIEFWDLTQKEKRSEAEGVPTNESQKNDAHIKVFEGKIDQIFENFNESFWDKFNYSDINNPFFLTWNKCVFEGTFKNRVPDGFGKFTDEYGNMYEGNWKNGLPDGKGIYKKLGTQIQYEGFWRKGLRNGIGRMVFEGGDVYSGTWMHDLICGRGTMKCTNWTTYEGFMFQTRMGPFLKKLFPLRTDVSDKNYFRPSQSLYIFGKEERGDFPSVTPLKNSQILDTNQLVSVKEQKPYDFHELSRETYFGEIKRGQRSGFGRMVTTDNSVFEGEFFEDMLIVENQRVVLEDDSRYEGSCLMKLVLDNNFAGARLVYKNMFVFESPHLKGKVTRLDGSLYEGDFVTKWRHGKGKLKFKDGATYEGGFSQNNFSGQGTFTTSKGQVYTGDFFEGFWVVHDFSYNFSNGDKYNGGALMSPRTPKDKKLSRIYKEDWVFKEMHGYGTLVESNGDIYVGKFVRNKKHGNGSLLIDGGKNPEGNYTKIIEGEFVNNLFWVQSANKTFELKEGRKYTGDFLARRLSSSDPRDQFVFEDTWYFQMEHGKGIAKYSDGSVYEGKFEEGQKSVDGKMIYPNGDVYEGMFACEWKDPYGKITFANGIEYRGEFEFGEISGKGTYKLPNGEKFEGVCKGEKIKQFMQNVKGRDGSIYTGWCWSDKTKSVEYSETSSIENIWKFSSKDGFGMLIRADGSIYTGNFFKNLKHGFGQLTFINGSAYRGYFEENKFEGLGKYIRKDGTFLCGTFKEGSFLSGAVNFYFKDGSVFKSEWDRTDFEQKSIVLLPDGDVIKVKKNSEIKDYLVLMIKSFPDWPDFFELPERDFTPNKSFRDYGRSETFKNARYLAAYDKIRYQLSLPVNEASKEIKQEVEDLGINTKAEFQHFGKDDLDSTIEASKKLSEGQKKKETKSLNICNFTDFENSNHIILDSIIAFRQQNSFPHQTSGSVQENMQVKSSLDQNEIAEKTSESISLKRMNLGSMTSFINHENVDLLHSSVAQDASFHRSKSKANFCKTDTSDSNLGKVDNSDFKSKLGVQNEQTLEKRSTPLKLFIPKPESFMLKKQVKEELDGQQIERKDD